MGDFKLNELASPLHAMRKIPKVNKAALFVEGLFDRPLRNDPLLLIINDENKGDVLKAAAKEFPHSSFSFRPLSPFFPSYTAEKALPDGTLMMGLMDILGPAKAFRRLTEAMKKDAMAYYLEGLAGKNPDVSATMYRPSFYPINNMVIMSGDWQIPNLVHELVHSEDFSMRQDKCRGATARIVLEGRAMYAEMVFNRVAQGEPPDMIKMFMDAQLTSLPRMIRIVAQCTPQVAEKKGWLQAGLWAVEGMIKAFKETSLEHELLYTLFTIALFELAVETGDPVRPFRMSIEKWPSGLRDLLNPLEFYQKEINQGPRFGFRDMRFGYKPCILRDGKPGQDVPSG